MTTKNVAAAAGLIGAMVACSSDDTSPPASNGIVIEGDVMEFLKEVSGTRISGAKVSIVEQPEKSFTTGKDAHFRFDGLVAGSEVTLLVEHPDFKRTQTAKLLVGPKGIEPFSIQLVTLDLFNTFSKAVPLPPELDKYCAIATTVARMGGSLYAHQRQGMPGVKVALSPAVPETGPIYFNQDARPDVDAPATSIDGGVLFYRLPPGPYTMTATKDDAVFNTMHFSCVAGTMVNMGPPMGLLANVVLPDHGLGKDRPADAFSASSDTLCATTARCVNEAAKATNYPEVTLKSCKATFRNTWSFVKEACDGAGALRNAAKTFFDCRGLDCANALGADDVCVPEEKAFRATELAYGTCAKGL